MLEYTDFKQAYNIFQPPDEEVDVAADLVDDTLDVCNITFSFNSMNLLLFNTFCNIVIMCILLFKR